MDPVRFGFDRADFDRVRAHDGDGLIRAARVLEQTGVSAVNFVDLVELPPGTSIGEHQHTLSDQELYVVIDGRGQMVVDGAALVVGPGDVVVNRPGGRHALTNDGPAPLRLVVVDVAADG